MQMYPHALRQTQACTHKQTLCMFLFNYTKSQNCKHKWYSTIQRSLTHHTTLSHAFSSGTPLKKKGHKMSLTNNIDHTVNY